MKHILLISFLLLCISQVVFSISQENLELFFKAKQLLREGSILADTSFILRARDIFLTIHKKEQTKHTLYFIAQSECELVRLGIAFENSNLFERYYESSVARSEQLTEQNPDWSEPYALLSMLYGYKIAKNSINAVTFGPKSYFLAEDALKSNKENPRAWFVAGIVKLHMPDFLGGGADEAITVLKKAIDIYENEPKADSLSPGWGYFDALTWLGWAYEKDDQPQEALRTYKKALSLEPRAKWIASMFLEPLQKKEGFN